jgi:hypothetical protein
MTTLGTAGSLGVGTIDGLTSTALFGRPKRPCGARRLTKSRLAIKRGKAAMARTLAIRGA